MYGDYMTLCKIGEAVRRTKITLLGFINDVIPC